MATPDPGKWSRATFRVFSLTLSVAEITSALDVRPTFAHEQGTPINARNSAGTRRDETIWAIESGLSDTEPLGAHIDKLIHFIESRLDGLKTLEPRCDFDIRCAFSSENGQGGFTLDSGALLRLTLLPIDLVVDLYPPTSRDSEPDVS